jgi:carboxymethylenebutenolidase
MGELIEVKRPDGKTCPAYLVEPKAGASAPGFVMIQEWWGLNDQIKAMAERLAGEGYRVLVPDLYRGKKATTPDEAGALMGALDFADAGRQDVRGCVQHLKKTSAKVAVGGFCLGGAVTVIAAVHVPEADASVCFYGIPPVAVADPALVKRPFQGHFANIDDWCTPAAVDELEKTLGKSGASFEIHRYQAQHAFMNEARPDVYDKACADLAWQRTKEFLARTLR